MPEKPVLALFDFCGTLINMQTANPFIMGLLKSRPSVKNRVREVARKLLKKYGMINGEQSKRLLVKQAAGIPLDFVTDYAGQYLRDILLKKENPTVVGRMEKHKERGDKVVIVSAGYENYIRLYAGHYGIDDVAATKLEEKDGVLTGKILKKDCIGEEKPRRLSKLMDLSSFDLKNSYAYGDHIFDAPLLELVGNRIVIDYGQNTDWHKTIGGKLLPV